MCTVSFIGETFRERWQPPMVQPSYVIVNPVTREEFDTLKREVELMHDLLRAAKKYDAEHGEPDCEMDEKVELLRRVAAMVGVDLSDVFEETT